MSNIKITGNEPVYAKAAFYHPDGGIDPPQEGMTIRQYYAGLAMQGLLVNYIENGDYVNDQFPDVSKKAIIAADDLINELNKDK